MASNRATWAARRATQYLFFPQWQGSVDPTLRPSAEHLRRALAARFRFDDVAVPGDIAPRRHGIIGYDTVASLLDAAREVIDRRAPHRLFTLGGDCGVEVAPVSYLNRRYDGDLALLWWDAHGDLNTPSSSPSGRYHGMPLRALLGDGHERFVTAARPWLRPAQLAMVGSRELDPPEQAYVDEHQVPVLGGDDADALLGAIRAWLDGSGRRHLYVHLDLDVIDPRELPYVVCATPGGLSLATVAAVLAELSRLRTCSLVGGSLLEYRSAAGHGIDRILELNWFPPETTPA